MRGREVISSDFTIAIVHYVVCSELVYGLNTREDLQLLIIEKKYCPEGGIFLNASYKKNSLPTIGGKDEYHAFSERNGAQKMYTTCERLFVE